MTVRLTPAQQRLIPYIVDGWYYQDIATAVGLGVRTVKMHVHQIAAKLPPCPHTPTYRRVQLWAINEGITTPATLPL